MGRHHRTMLLGAIAFIAILFIGAGFAIADVDQNSACDTCHTNTSVLTLGSNATGTVDAIVGEQFILVIDAAAGSEAIKIVTGLANNNQFTYSTQLVEDGDGEDTNDNTGEITVAVTITPQSAGSFTIQIWAASGPVSDLKAASLDVSVNVVAGTGTGTTTTSPTPTTTTPTTTTPTPTTLSEEERKEIWYTQMYVFTPVTAIILSLVGLVIIRRAGPQ